jgi:hypothetical protein
MMLHHPSLDHLDPTVDHYHEGDNSHPLYVNESERMWNIIRHDFSIRRRQAWETFVFIRDHVHDISWYDVASVFRFSRVVRE